MAIEIIDDDSTANPTVIKVIGAGRRRIERR